MTCPAYLVHPGRLLAAVLRFVLWRRRDRERRQQARAAATARLGAETAAANERECGVHARSFTARPLHPVCFCRERAEVRRADRVAAGVEAQPSSECAPDAAPPEQAAPRRVRGRARTRRAEA